MLCVKLNEITRTPVEGVLKFIPTCVQGKEHCVGLDTLILLILKHTRALLGVGGIQYFVFLLQVFFFLKYCSMSQPPRLLMLPEASVKSFPYIRIII